MIKTGDRVVVPARDGFPRVEGVVTKMTTLDDASDIIVEIAHHPAGLIAQGVAPYSTVHSIKTVEELPSV